MLKVALVGAVTLAVAAGATWWGLQYVSIYDCVNTVIEEAISPSRAYKAVLFERSCGATTGFSSQLSVIAANAELPNESGNAFVADGYPAGYKLNWIDDSTLQVVGAGGRVFKRESRISAVSIRFE